MLSLNLNLFIGIHLGPNQAVERVTFDFNGIGIGQLVHP